MPRRVHGLMRTMEQPYVGALWHQCLEFITLRLHVLPVDEQVHSLGCRRWRDRYGGSGRGGSRSGCLGGCSSALARNVCSTDSDRVRPRLVCQLQQAKQDISDPMGYALFVGRVRTPRDSLSVVHWNISNSPADSTVSAMARFLGVWRDCQSRAAAKLRSRVCSAEISILYSLFIATSAY